jgi:predicted transcriptional regulator
MNIFDLFSSENRCRIIRLLGSGQKRTFEIRHDLGISKTAVSQHVSRLLREGFITKADNKLRLSNKGMIFELYLRKLEETFSVIERHPDFWMDHDIKSIPESLRLRLGEIGDYRLVKVKGGNLLRLYSIFDSVIRDAEFIRVVSSIVFPRYTTILAEISRRSDISIIVTEEVMCELLANHEREIETLLLNGGKIYINNSVKIVCLITHEKLCLGLYFSDGSYDITAILVSEDDSAVKWGEDLFKYFMETSSEFRKGYFVNTEKVTWNSQE